MSTFFPMRVNQHLSWMKSIAFDCVCACVFIYYCRWTCFPGGHASLVIHCLRGLWKTESVFCFNFSSGSVETVTLATITLFVYWVGTFLFVCLFLLKEIVLAGIDHFASCKHWSTLLKIKVLHRHRRTTFDSTKNQSVKDSLKEPSLFYFFIMWRTSCRHKEP